MGACITAGKIFSRPFTRCICGGDFIPRSACSILTIPGITRTVGRWWCRRCVRTWSFELFLLKSTAISAYCFKITFMRLRLHSGRVHSGRVRPGIVRCAGFGLLLNVPALLILRAALLAWHPAAVAGPRDLASKSGLAAAGANFAIADFDGDALPDFATVQPGPMMASRTSYWIQFNFSLGTQRSFEVSAPPGGLQIASRDVNGDSFLDLIISTRIANEPVAVLLNDGRGNFHLAKREAFAWTTWEARSEWRARTVCRNDNASAMASTGWAARIYASCAGMELRLAMAGVSLSSQKPDNF